MAVVANVAVNLDARGVTERLKAIRQTSVGAADGFKKLGDRAKAVKAIVEAQQGGFAKASTIQGVFAAKVRNTEQAIKAQISALRDVQSKVQLGGAIYQKAARQIADYERVLKEANQTQEQAAQSGNRLTGVASAVGKLALAYGTLRTAQAALQAGIGRIESERRIQFLARGYGEAAQLATAASRAAEKFGVSQTEANQALANTYARLRPVGIELSTIESVYAGFNTAARISGASAVEASNAFTQLAQALGSGALRGDEFNSISEQVPGILTAISKETGVAQGALRKYAADGKITADIVIRALQRIEKEGADQLAEALDGPAQKIKDFQKATEDVQVALTEAVIPELATSLKGLAELIRNLEGPIRFIGGIAANTIGTVNDLINLATKPGQVASRKAIESGRLPLDSGAAVFGVGPTADLFEGTGPGGAGLKELTEQARELSGLRNQPFEKVLVQLMQDRLKTMDAAMQGAVEQEKDKPDRPRPQPDKTKETKKTTDYVAKQKIEALDVLKAEQNRLQVAQATGELQKRITQSIVKQNEIKDSYAKKLADAKSIEEVANLQVAERVALQANALDLQTSLADSLRETTQPLDDLAKASADRLEFERKYQELLNEGISPELARQFAQIELTAEKESEKLAVELQSLKNIRASAAAQGAIVTALDEQIKKTEELIKKRGGTAAQAKQDAAASDKEKNERERRQQEAEDKAERLKNLYRGVVNTLEDGLVNSVMVGIDALMGKTKDLGRALQEIASGVLQDIGKQLIRFGINAAMRGIFGGAFAAEGAYWSGGFKAFANGGMVTSPTIGLVGEGGEPEYIIPASKMDGAMARYSAGARGSSVIPQNGDSMAAGGGGGGGGGTFTLETVVINNVEYATVDQVRAMGQQAAAKGAESGYTKSMRTLQNSRSQRSKLGIGR